MSDLPVSEPAPELTCANCGRRLDVSDKFCRDCGLPTVHRLEAQLRAPAPPPDTAELKRALDVAPDPAPFLRAEPEMEAEPAEPDSTSAVVRATSPTHATRMAASTLVMVALIVVFAAAGVVLLVLALRP